ncbi:mannosyl-oligosaccharide 1,2-alpha-mannosidase IC-like [Diretmus argenteus]
MVFRKLPGVSASGMGLRLSQKFVFLLFLSGLVTLCFGALFFLPDSVRLKRIFLSKTESQPVTVGSGSGGSENDAAANKEHVKPRAKEPPEHPRGSSSITSARGETMRGETRGETSSTKLKAALSRRPAASHEATEERLAGGRAQEDMTLPRSKAEAGSERVTSSNPGADPDTYTYEKFKGCLLKPPLGRERGRPSDPQTGERRDKVKEMMKFAWDNYKRYAWGKNELRPLTRNGHIGNMFGGLRGASIIDSLDTLYIMGLTEEYNDAKEWVQTSLDLNSNGEASLFEVNIRYVGGLLSAYYLTGEEIHTWELLSAITLNATEHIHTQQPGFLQGHLGGGRSGGVLMHSPRPKVTKRPSR